MIEAQGISVDSPELEKWNEKAVFEALAEFPRRMLFRALIQKGPQTAEQLSPDSHKRSAALKHLENLRLAGLVNKKPNPVDGRKPIYEVAATVTVSRHDSICLVDLGHCVFRLPLPK